jgi:hypothetical protein
MPDTHRAKRSEHAQSTSGLVAQGRSRACAAPKSKRGLEALQTPDRLDGQPANGWYPILVIEPRRLLGPRTPFAGHHSTQTANTARVGVKIPIEHFGLELHQGLGAEAFGPLRLIRSLPRMDRPLVRIGNRRLRRAPTTQGLCPVPLMVRLRWK